MNFHLGESAGNENPLSASHSGLPAGAPERKYTEPDTSFLSNIHCFLRLLQQRPRSRPACLHPEFCNN